MSKPGVNIGGNGRNKLPEVSEEEEEDIRDFTEKFGVKQNTRSGGKKHLHLVKKGDTLCKVEMHRVDLKDPAVYPPGFFPICKRCAYYWRMR